jgi:hypothetical protein
LACLLTGLGLVLALGGGPIAEAGEPPYPTREQLRELQLATFNCARDNQQVDCDRALQQADPLLDHPLLPGSCKDALWVIREQAVVVPQNSFERRDRLDRAGEDLMRFCPRNPRPVQPTPSAPGRPPGAGLIPGFRGGAPR